MMDEALVAEWEQEPVEVGDLVDEFAIRLVLSGYEANDVAQALRNAEKRIREPVH